MSAHDRVSLELLQANLDVWGGRITYRDNRDGSYTATYTQDGSVIGSGVGASKAAAKIALAHAVRG